jgi:predicted phage terminase large subunit-like protein
MVNDVDQVIHHDWIQTYSSIPQVILDGYHETICGVDFAASEKAKADHSALVSLIVAWHDNKLKVYVLPDPFYGRVTFPAFQEQIAAKYAGVTDSRPVKFIVESNGMQKGLVQILETAGLPVEAVHVSTDKRARVAMISPLIKSGQVEFHYMSNKQLITQLTGFGVEKYDDLVDALTIALNYVISDFKPIGTYGEYAYESAELWYDSPTAGLDEIVF